MKSEVLKIVQNALAAAQDDLDRVNMEFGRMNNKQLSEIYGKSGQKGEEICAEIIEELQARKAELKRCVAWVNSAK